MAGAIEQFKTDYAGKTYLASAVSRVGENYRLRGKLENAAAVWVGLADDLPNSKQAPEALYLAGECYSKTGNYEKSIACYQKLADDYPGYFLADDGLYQMGRCYEKLEKAGVISKTEAGTNIRTAYEKLIAEYPGSHAAAIAERWLDK